MEQDKLTIGILARISALELLLPRLFEGAYAALGVTPEQAKKDHDALRAMMRLEGVPGVDPAMSDHISGEVQEAIERILKTVEERLARPTD